MKDCSLAVIIPNYNNEKYIAQCIESILSQTLMPDEIIVVDDCSTDGSAEIISEYEGKYDNIKCVYLKKNGGVSNARNIGIQTAKSEYVSFMDADDFYYSKDKLKNEMETIKRFLNKGRDVLVYSATVSGDNNGDVTEYPTLKSSKYINANARYHLISRTKMSSVPHQFMVKKSVVLNVGAYSFYKNFYEDLDLLMRLSFLVDFHFVPQYGDVYRSTAAGLSKRPACEHTDTVNEIVNNYYAKLNAYEKLMVNKYRLMKKVKMLAFKILK